MSILAFAYACEPGKGSEPGAGWDWARLLASLDDTCVITRSNNAAAIEHALPDIAGRDRLTFAYVDLPRWARSWKRGQRGIRAYYFIWLWAALARARKLRRRTRFDLVWHLTLANAWMGTTASLAGGTFVYGPVGGGAAAPVSLLPTLGPRGIAFELTRGLVISVARYLNPLARLAWRRAALILVQNNESMAWLPRRHRHKAVVFQNALPKEASANITPSQNSRMTLLFAGRLLPLKGVALALHALEYLPAWRLIVCGTGPDEARLRRAAEKIGLRERVDFRGWVSREELGHVMREEADVFIFPSLHDQAPLVVAEAIAAGLPVVSLDRGGAPLLGSIAVPARSPRRTARDLAAAVISVRDRPPTTLPSLHERREQLQQLLVERNLLAKRP